MKPVETIHTNKIFKLPGGTEENDLPVCICTLEDGKNAILSVWQLDDKERAAIAAGENIRLVVWGTSMYPVAIDLTDETVV